MKRVLTLISILSILVSCDSQSDKRKKSIDEIGFNALEAIKTNNKQNFLALFDPTVVAQTPKSQLDSTFEFYRTILAGYDFPNFDSWKKDRFFYQIDTVKRTLAIGLPLINLTNSKVDFVFEMQFSPDNALTGIKVNKIADVAAMPDSEFPQKKEAFNYSFDSLLSIRLYYLPGLNSNPKLSKSVEFASTEFNDKLKRDFGNIISDLNQSRIVNAEKTISQQPTSNDLKAVTFTFKEGDKQISLFLISNNITERPLEINEFYTVNATYAYKLNDSNTAQLKEDISALIRKYIK